jgi:hypothetical protein
MSASPPKADVFQSPQWARVFGQPNFDPIAFKIEAGQAPALLDAKGRELWSVACRPIGDKEQDAVNDAVRSDDETILVLMLELDDVSDRNLTAAVESRLTAGGKPWTRYHVQQVLKGLKEGGLATVQRGGWELTKKGKQQASAAPSPSPSPF